ncbi:ATP-binding protein [Mariprofundus ferrooxydans]|uniref:hybrid sensor histidine kinase/response regulator n=1 Tax=Mariprofundus ferrooxydans TaxID=314344 RepID=UPI0003A3CF23|nr:ATP-binding protein [Mariprofundus ferrooxydans]
MLLLTMIVCAEIGIMLLFSWLDIENSLSPLALAFTDALLLSLIIAFPLYYWVVRPLKSTIITSQEKLNMLASAVENAGEAIIITNRKGVVEYVNQAFLDMSGYNNIDIIAKHVASIEVFMAEKEWKQSFLQSIRRFGVWKAEQWEERKNGEKYLAEITVTPIHLTKAEKITHFVTIKQDNTKRHDLESQLRQAQKMEAVGTLVGGIAHDFNNMLSALAGQLYLAKSRIKGNEEVYERLSKMEVLTFRAADMISQLLTFARKGVINKTDLVLNSFIKEAAKLAQVGLPENIRFNCNITDEYMVVRADATQWQQVIMNLINNAHDAVSDIHDAKISLSLALTSPQNPNLDQFNPSTDRYAELCISDNGCGIKKENLDKIIEPFFTTKEAGKGTGLGLAMVHGVVESHHGFMDIDSEEGNGTTFRIFLPLVEPQHNETSESEIIHKGHGESILLVDDDLMVREAGREVLELLGYHVFVAEDGAKAIQICQNCSNQISLVIMDVVMPHMQGGEAAIHIKKSHPNLPVILVTGYDKENVMNNDVLSIVDATMSKPYSTERLSTLIKQTLASVGDKDDE